MHGQASASQPGGRGHAGAGTTQPKLMENMENKIKNRCSQPPLATRTDDSGGIRLEVEDTEITKFSALSTVNKHQLSHQNNRPLPHVKDVTPGRVTAETGVDGAAHLSV